MEANFRMMLDEMQRIEVRLGEKIEGRCSSTSTTSTSVPRRDSSPWRWLAWRWIRSVPPWTSSSATSS
jgi:hypothetical protein